MNVNYDTLEDDLVSGTFRQQLESELEDGFQKMRESGERLPPASYYAAQIAEIVSGAAPAPLNPEIAFAVYQEILSAVESARASVLGEE